MTSTEADPDDLYADLTSANRAPSSANKSHLKIPIPPKASQVPSASVQILEKRVEDLAEENRRLKRNIGTLYRTAKAEMKRKDDKIASLLLEVEQLKK
jgi:hypothetical protein